MPAKGPNDSHESNAPEKVRVFLQKLHVEMEEKKPEKEEAKKLVRERIRNDLKTAAERVELSKQVQTGVDVPDTFKKGNAGYDAVLENETVQPDSKGLGGNGLSNEAKVGIGIGAVVVGGVLLWQLFKKKAVQTGEAVKTGAYKAWSFLKWTFLFAAAGTLGYMGFKGLKKLQKLEELQGKAREAYNDVRNAVKDTKDQMLRDMDALTEKVRNATTKEEREKYEAQIKEVEAKGKEKIDELQKSVDELLAKQAAENEAKAKRAEEEKKKPNETLKSAVKAVDTPENEAAAKEAAKVKAVEIFAKTSFFLHQDEMEQAEVNETVHKDAVTTVIRLMMQQKDLTVGQLVGCAEPTQEQAKGKLEAMGKRIGMPDDEAHYRALYFLALSTKARLPFLGQAAGKAKSEKNVNDWSIEEMIEKSRMMNSYTERTMDQFKGKKLSEIDMKKVFTEVFNNKNWMTEIAEDPAVRERFQGIVKNTKDFGLNLEDKDTRARFVLFCETNSRTAISALRNVSRKNPEEEMFVTFLENIGTRAQTALPYLQTFTHGHRRSAWLSEGKESSAVLAERMQHVNVQDAMQLFAYLNGAAPEDLPKNARETPALAALLLQLKVMYLLSEEDRDQGLLFRDWLVKEYVAGDTNVQLPPELYKILGLPLKKEALGGALGIVGYGLMKANEWIGEGAREGASKVENVTGIPFNTAKPAIQGLAYYGIGRGTLGALVNWHTRGAIRLASDLNYSGPSSTKLTNPTWFERLKNGVNPFRPFTHLHEAHALRADVFENLKTTGKSAQQVVEALSGRGYTFGTIESAMLKNGFAAEEIAKAIETTKSNTPLLSASGVRHRIIAPAAAFVDRTIVTPASEAVANTFTAPSSRITVTPLNGSNGAGTTGTPVEGQIPKATTPVPEVKPLKTTPNIAPAAKGTQTAEVFAEEAGTAGKSFRLVAKVAVPLAVAEGVHQAIVGKNEVDQVKGALLAGTAIPVVGWVGGAAVILDDTVVKWIVGDSMSSAYQNLQDEKLRSKKIVGFPSLSVGGEEAWGLNVMPLAPSMADYAHIGLAYQKAMEVFAEKGLTNEKLKASGFKIPTIEYGKSDGTKATVSDVKALSDLLGYAAKILNEDHGNSSDTYRDERFLIINAGYAEVNQKMDRNPAFFRGPGADPASRVLDSTPRRWAGLADRQERYDSLNEDTKRVYDEYSRIMRSQKPNREQEMATFLLQRDLEQLQKLFTAQKNFEAGVPGAKSAQQLLSENSAEAKKFDTSFSAASVANALFITPENFESKFGRIKTVLSESRLPNSKEKGVKFMVYNTISHEEEEVTNARQFGITPKVDTVTETTSLASKNLRAAMFEGKGNTLETGRKFMENIIDDGRDTPAASLVKLKAFVEIGELTSDSFWHGRIKALDKGDAHGRPSEFSLLKTWEKTLTTWATLSFSSPQEKKEHKDLLNRAAKLFPKNLGDYVRNKYRPTGS